MQSCRGELGKRAADPGPLGLQIGKHITGNIEEFRIGTAYGAVRKTQTRSGYGLAAGIANETGANAGLPVEADKVRAEAQVQEFGLELENLKTQQAAAQSALQQDLQLFEIGAQVSGNLLNASLQRQRIQADIMIAQLQIAAAAAGRSSGGVRLGGTTFGPGGPLGSFSRFSSAGRGGAAPFSGGVSPFIIGSSGGATQGATISPSGPFAIGGFTPSTTARS